LCFRICPHKFFNSDFGSGMRSFFVKNSAINFIVSFGNNLVFKTATTYTGIIVLSKSNQSKFLYYEFPLLPNAAQSVPTANAMERLLIVSVK